MTLTGIILMVAGFIGVLVCAKLQKSNPSIQPVAILCAVVMIGGLAVYGYGYMNGDDNTETAKIYAMATGNGVGKYLKQTVPGKRIVYVVNPGMENSDYAKSQAEAMKKAYGGDVEIATIDVPQEVRESGDVMGYLKPDHIDKVVAKDPAAVYVLDIGMPEKGTPRCFSSAKDRPAVFLTNSGMADMRSIKKLIKDGKLVGILIGNPAKRDPNFEPSARKLDEAFNRQYVIVGKDNLDKYKDKF